MKNYKIKLIYNEENNINDIVKRYLEEKIKNIINKKQYEL